MFDGVEKLARHGGHKRESVIEASFSKGQIVVRGGAPFLVVAEPKRRFRRAWVRSVGPDRTLRGIAIYESFDRIRLATDEEKKKFGFST